jgi:hypothetical protein
VDVEVTIDDPDNADPILLQGSIDLLVGDIPDPLATYYVATDGNDANTGLSRDDPWNTLRHALAVAQCGDLILVAPGIYRERVDFDGRLCPAARPLVLRRRDAERPVLDNGILLDPLDGAWTLHRDDIYCRNVAVPEDKYIRVLTLDGKRTMRYRALADLELDATSDLQLRRCFYQERIDPTTRRLCVRTGAGDSPQNHTLVLGQNDGDETRDWGDNVALLFTNASHVVVDGFEVRNSGGRGAAFSTGADYNLITNCLLHANNGNVEIRHGTANRIWNNDIHEWGTGDYPWRAFYDDRTEGTDGYDLVDLRGGIGHSIVGNDIHDGWDLLSAGFGWSENGQGETDILYNRLWNSSDDGLELDGPGINVRVHGNQFRHVFSGVSLAPTTVGPTYVTRNTFTYDLILFKLNNCMGEDQDGSAFVYHNSAYALRTCAGTGITSAPWDCDGPRYVFGNKRFRNNVMLTGHAVLRGRPEMDLDYDAYGVPDGAATPFTWSPAPDVNHYLSIEDLRSETGLEQHGFMIDPAGPGWVAIDGLRAYDCPTDAYEDYRTSDYAVYEHPFGGEDFALVGTSVLIDKGEVLPGFNDDYTGSAPDLGAIELSP